MKQAKQNRRKDELRSACFIPQPSSFILQFAVRPGAKRVLSLRRGSARFFDGEQVLTMMDNPLQLTNSPRVRASAQPFPVPADRFRHPPGLLLRWVGLLA